MRQNLVKAAVTFMTLLLVATTLQAEKIDAKTGETAQNLAKRGVDFLVDAQEENGSFSSFAGSGVTSIVTAALLESGLKPDDPTVKKSLAYLMKNIQPDGGIYTPRGFWKNYETSVAILCLTKANRDGEYDEPIANAKKFIKGLQWDESNDQTPESINYGGAGYGKGKRADLSNTAFFVDALKATGTKANDPALEKALVFIGHCQNYATSSDTPDADQEKSDGGFGYLPVGAKPPGRGPGMQGGRGPGKGGPGMGGPGRGGPGMGGGRGPATTGRGSLGKELGRSSLGEKPPAEQADGLKVYGLKSGPRSYGSMTYAGLKSMIYAGLTPDDPRVKAALRWISDNYTVKTNPGMGDAGLFYYYHTFAKTFKTLGMDEVVDADGQRHNWREELVAELAARQQEDGSWKNTDSRWLEGDSNLVTAYVLLALAAVQGK